MIAGERELEKFIDEYTPEIAAIARGALAKLRRRLGGAIEFVYDNFNALVIGFGPTERPSEAIVSIALYPRWVNLFFLDGADLPDPQGLLRGSGNVVRRIAIESPATLDDPAVVALLDEAKRRAAAPFDRKTARKVVIRAVAPKRRSRRPAQPVSSGSPRSRRRTTRSRD